MAPRELIGQWSINANNYAGKLELWQSGGVWTGRIWFDVHQKWENLTAITLSQNTLAFTRGVQVYRGDLAYDELMGTFTDNGQSFPWRAQRSWSNLTRISSVKPNANFITNRAASPTAPTVLVLVEERLWNKLQGTQNGGSSVFQRYLDDLQNEGWEVFAYRYDVRSDETGEQYHRHLPSEVLPLYKFIRNFYHTANGKLNGVVLIGDFPAAGAVVLEDRQIGTTLEQHEMYYYCVDAMLSDPFGYWEWLPVAPMVEPGSPIKMRLPYDEGRHPSGGLNPRYQWSPPAFVLSRQSEVHHSQRHPNRFGAEPKFWIGRITAAQAAWRTGPQGWEYAIDEEMRLLVDYFNRNHIHRTTSRTRNGYIFVTDPGLAGWQAERNKMSSVIPQANIAVNADDATLAANKRASIANLLKSFQEDRLVCELVLHSDFLNHAFNSPGGFPSGFPTMFNSPGSNSSIPIPHGTTVKSIHLMAMPSKTTTSRFYLMGGCDIGTLMHRPQYLVDGERVSPATPLNRHYAAFGLGVSYLMHGNGLAVVAHNTINPTGDYTPIYEAWRVSKSLGDGVLILMQNERNAGIPHYRNVIFGDPTLRLSY